MLIYDKLHVPGECSFMFGLMCLRQLEIHPISNDDFEFLIIGLFQHSEDISLFLKTEK